MIYELWQDRRDVHYLTTMHHSEMMETENTDWLIDKAIRKSVADLEFSYTKNMGTVVVGDIQQFFNMSVG